MKATKIVFGIIVSLLVINIITSEEVQVEENVLVLTDKNFEEVVSKEKYILVEFYAPWCGHCKQLAPEYAKAAEILKTREPAIKLAKVDATAERGLAERFKIEGFPTLKFFINNKEVEYSGGRTSNDIVSWLLKKSGPAVATIETSSALLNLTESNRVYVVFFGSDSHANFASFNAVAQVNDSFQFGQFKDEAKFSEYGAQAGDIIVFKQFDEKKEIFPSARERTEGEIVDFLHAASTPLVSEFDENIAEIIFGNSKNGIFLYRDPAKHSNLDEVLRQVAPKYKGKIYFVANGITGDFEEKLAEYIGVTEADLPVVKIHEVTQNDVRKYTLKGDITKDNIEKFIEQFFAKELSPEYKSEEIPASSEPENGVYKVVGKNWTEVVLDSTKDVVVFFYAPWCGHCKGLHPKYEEVATTLKNITTLKFAKFDATANEVDGEGIEHYPTLRLYSAKNKTAEEFEARSQNEILKFLKGKELLTAIPSDITFPEEPEEVPEEEEHDHDHDHDHDHEHEDVGEEDDGNEGGEEVRTKDL